jgi:hypothetical protein
MPAATEKQVRPIQISVAMTAKILPITGTKTKMLATTAAMVGGRLKFSASFDSCAVNGPRSRKIR